MDKDREAFLQELLADFRVEAVEHCQAIVERLLALEQAPGPAVAQPLCEAMGREAHSLKGAARVVQLTSIERLCQALETALAQLKISPEPPSAAVLDVLHQALGLLDECLRQEAAGQGAAPVSGLSAVVQALENLPTGEARPPAPAVEPLPTEPAPVAHAAAEPPSASAEEPPTERATAPSGGAFAETVRISTAKLGALLREAEELVTVKSMLGYYLTDLRRIAAREEAWSKAAQRAQPESRSVAPEAEDHARAMAADVAALAARLDQDRRVLGRLVDDLLRDMKKTLMLPVGSLLGLLPKVARDLARDTGKQVSVTVHGEHIEVDRRILEELKDPLIHIVRNCVDHGIEPAAQRQLQHKPARAAITIDVTQPDSRRVLITIGDDGAGIDTAQARRAAVRLGVLSAEAAERLSERDAQALIFASGVSTSQFITDLSGRGLGMAIVAEKVARLGGTVSVESQPGAGTHVALLLPVALATFRGVLVRVAQQLLVVPTAHVERATRVRLAQLKTVESQPTLELDGRVVPVVVLGELLGIPSQATAGDTPLPTLVLVAGQRRIAFTADEVLDEHEGLLKDLGPQLVHVRNLAGATLLGDGRVVPILDVAELLDAAAQQRRPARAEAGEERAPQRTVLVAEDSITARSLLRNILESAGYAVSTAVDGLDALTQLRSGAFDLLVSDVQMPQLDGFELTAKLRAEPRTRELPVVLVTALDSPADRARGMDAGADAYIVKSSFEQSNLLEVVRRLV